MSAFISPIPSLKYTSSVCPCSSLISSCSSASPLNSISSLLSVSPDTLPNSSSSLQFVGKKGGRLPGSVFFTHVDYNTSSYTVFTIMYKQSDIQFVIDKEDFNRVSEHIWHLSSGKYIGTNYRLEDGTIKEIYLHNFIMNILTLVSGNDKDIVVHKHKNNLDNRKENLRIVHESTAHFLKAKRKRTVQLPEGCGFSPDEIPRHINFVKESGNHGPRFSIEIPSEGILWKSSSSKKVPLLLKLEEAKEKIKEIYSIYPHLNMDSKEETETLRTSFEEIIKLSQQL